ncbi:MAG TPA: sensor histidine kinase [Candidatus Limnocylindrales bacterium]|nr:sensor histidine kinase [Candidatus Limnocylindrales bacterium]
MSQAAPVLGRALDLGRRLARTPEWPLAAAVLTAILAMGEVTGVLIGQDTVSVGVDTRYSGSPSLALLLALLATVPLAVVRTRLLAAAVTITVVNYLTLIGSYPPTVGAAIAQATVGYLLARHRTWRAWVPTLLPLAAYIFVATGAPTDERTRAAGMLAVAAIAAVAGSMIRGQAEAAERRAAERAAAGTLLENAARGERARIARELHDVVAHHISMISVQAEVARLTTAGLPALGAERFAAIGDTAREALAAMRRLLGVLREDSETVSSRTPQPGLADVLTLVDESREAGSGGTRIIVSGHVMPLDPGVELTAYRIIQEALTNARRHAPGAAVDVEINYAPDTLHARVRDNGPGMDPDASPASAQTGLGLLGMRERAATVGGQLRAGPTRHGGFQVEVVLPIEPGEQ